MKNTNTPGVFLRVKAAFVDSVIMVLLFLAATDLFSNITVNTNYKILTFLLIVVLYEPLMVTINKATVGHRLFKLKVVQQYTGKRITIIAAIIRFVIKALLRWVSFFTITSNKNNQAIHDIATRSVVVIDEDYI